MGEMDFWVWPFGILVVDFASPRVQHKIITRFSRNLFWGGCISVVRKGLTTVSTKSDQKEDGVDTRRAASDERRSTNDRRGATGDWCGHVKWEKWKFWVWPFGILVVDFASPRGQHKIITRFSRNLFLGGCISVVRKGLATVSTKGDKKRMALARDARRATSDDRRTTYEERLVTGEGM